MKILVVSGFLGAGKTTFIQALAKATGKEFAILENEFANVNVDGARMEADEQIGQVNIWEMTEGCICCSAKGDFAASILTIANSVDPDILVVEPTGVGKLSNIIENLQKIEYERISIMAPITIVDAHSIDRFLREYPDIYQDQVAYGATVFVSKSEHLSADEKARIRQQLQQLDPAGRIVVDHYSSLDCNQWNELLEKDYQGKVFEQKNDKLSSLLNVDQLLEEENLRTSAVGTEGDSTQFSGQEKAEQEERNIQNRNSTEFSESALCQTGVSSPGQSPLPDSFAMKEVSMEHPGQLVVLMENLIHGRYGNVFRAKGQIKAGPGWYQFDLADGLYTIMECAPMTVGKVAFIGTDLDKWNIRKFFIKKNRRKLKGLHR